MHFDFIDDKAYMWKTLDEKRLLTEAQKVIRQDKQKLSAILNGKNMLKLYVKPRKLLNETFIKHFAKIFQWICTLVTSC